MKIVCIEMCRARDWMRMGTLKENHALTAHTGTFEWIAAVMLTITATT